MTPASSGALSRSCAVLLIGRVADRLARPFLVAGGRFAVCGVLVLAWG